MGKLLKGSYRRRLLGAVYIVIGVFVAVGHEYFSHLDGVKPVVSAILAVFLWPFVLFGLSLHFK